MASPQFYNENRNRHFPFVKNTVGSLTSTDGPIRRLLNEWIVYAGFVLGLESQFGFVFANGQWRPVENQVFLQRIYRSGDQVFFEFDSDADLLHTYPLTFTRSSDDALYTVEYADSSNAPEDEIYPLEPCMPPMWSGYLVTGNLQSLFALLADGQELHRGSDLACGIVEPALLRNQFRTYINDFSVANADRTRATAPHGCPPLTWDYPTDVIFVSARCIVGDIRWMEGYNCLITQNDTDNSITIGANVGSGAGQPCNEIPLAATETPPVDSTNPLLEGGPQCDQTVRSVNGLGGPQLTIFAGQGVSIVPVPGSNKVVVDVNMLGMAVCFSLFSQFSENL